MTPRTQRQRRGAQAIEFAILLPVLLAFLFGIVDYGWYFGITHCARQTAVQAVRTGALTAVADDPVAAAVAKGDAYWAGLGLPATITTTAQLSGAAPQLLEVTVTIDSYALSGFVPGPATIESNASRRLEEQP